MNKLFYPKLAITNMKKNGKIYLPYIGASVFIIAMFLMIHAIASSEEVRKLYGGDNLAMMLGFGIYVIGIFSVIILFYTNNFLMKQRKKELGLYNILGMEKKHIAKILFYETLFTAIISIGLGGLSGVLFKNFIYLILLKFLRLPGSLDISFSGMSLVVTAILFLGIFLMTLFFNLVKIQLTNPIDLLKGGQKGEKEPKTRRLLAFIGFLSLGVAYYLALSIESPLQAFYMFFIAVVLVILGTYCLFVAGSIVILKQLRRKKKLYYQSRFFIAISGMMYRMKQHAVGLASICILSTMVLVTLTTTVSLYMGQDDIVNKQFPREYTISVFGTTNEEIEKIHGIVEKEANKHRVTPKNILAYKSITLFVTNHNGTFENAGDFPNLANSYDIRLITLEDYRLLTGNNDSLAKNEVLLYGGNDGPSSKINIAGKSFEIVRKLDDFPGLPVDTSIINTMILVVHNMDVAMDIFYRTTGGKLDGPVYFFGFDLDAEGENRKEFIDAVNQRVREDIGATLQTRQDARESSLSFFGGFLFLGVFLGTLFFMATGLILYYKQISEGYEDRERFHIMQKVGMSKEEVKEAIKSQTLMVFFLPLIMAVIHIAFAFEIITKLLALFNLTNVTLFFYCMVLTIAVFAIVYVILYRLTAKAYYKIVN